MGYTPHTDKERRHILDTIGIERLSDLFADIPTEHRFPNLDLPEAMSELEILRELRSLSNTNLNAEETPTFLGAGAYRHWIPSLVDHVIRRGEFATAYTPYQAEVSQGTLQAIFEYQSLICDLTGMDVANASHYDGATAAAEAVVQAYNLFRGKRRKIVIAPTLHPHYREVIRTYTQGMELTLIGQDWEPDTPISELVNQVDEETACLIIQSPNFLGQIEALDTLKEAIAARDKRTLLTVVTHPLSLGLLKPPGDYGADIVLGEGQPLGLGLNYGGPYLGFYTTREKHVRQISGRVVGKTVDVEGNEGFVMTLTTREQHIRRERATSNICTNQGLMALAATVYLSALGKQGLREVAELNYHKAHYAADQIDTVPGFSVERSRPFFNEFIVRGPMPAREINRYLLEEAPDGPIIGGYDLSQTYPQLDHAMLIAVTEMNTREEIDMLVRALRAMTEDATEQGGQP
jgi:glycine dehydrogenase subunit 1